ncbi:unnamed protein product [Boreogadus saida]
MPQSTASQSLSNTPAKSGSEEQEEEAIATLSAKMELKCQRMPESLNPCDLYANHLRVDGVEWKSASSDQIPSGGGEKKAKQIDGC